MGKLDLRNKGIEVLDKKHAQLVRGFFIKNGASIGNYKFSQTKDQHCEGRYYYVNEHNRVCNSSLHNLLSEQIELIELPNIENSEDFDFSINPNDLPFITPELENDYTETAEFFDEVIEQTITQLTETLLVKGKEYRRNGNPFHNFEVGARKENKTREEVLHGFALKHEISIGDIRNDLSKGILPKAEQVNEKFNDLIIYLLIEKASILERLKTNENAN